jgi:RND family efflux transporter MFP subunit
MKPAVKTLSFFTLVLMGVGVFWGWNTVSSQNDIATAIEYVSPRQSTVASTVLASGVIQLRVGAKVRVGSQMSGIVEELNVIIGSRIEQGDIIARIDSRGLVARLVQAQAQVAVLEQEVRRAEVELMRAKKLDVKNLVARTEVEDRTMDLEQAHARLEKSRSDAAVVKTDLAYATIRAPISGTVSSVATQKGETVAAAFNTPTFAIIIAEDSVELVAMVDETDIGNIKKGNPVHFTVEAYPAIEFEGQVKQIAPTGSIISGVVNFQVMIHITSPTAILKPDMTANVSIQTDQRQALMIPNSAIQREGFDRFVYVEQQGKLFKRSVTVGVREEGFTEIRKGIELNEQLAIKPVTPDIDVN